MTGRYSNFRARNKKRIGRKKRGRRRAADVTHSYVYARMSGLEQFFLLVPFSAFFMIIRASGGRLYLSSFLAGLARLRIVRFSKGLIFR